MLRVGVVGAAGYAGIEAVRWTLGHPHLRLTLATSTADAGAPIGALYPALASATGLAFTGPDPDTIVESCDAVILAVPHTAAAALVPTLLSAGVRVFDLSADFRLKDRSTYEKWYEVVHPAPELLAEAVYGLPEVARIELEGARLVACPGCYPTASALAVVPALEAGIVTGDKIIVDAKSGVSGAGRGATPTTHFINANESLAAYKVAAHRHAPEMRQTMSGLAGRDLPVLFTPHLVPVSRGLLATVYVDVRPGFSNSEAQDLYAERYANEPFVDLMPSGVMPSTGQVRGTNRAAVGVHVDESTSTLIATCAIDNLGKGAAGQAIQCLNLAYGFDETDGLSGVGAVV